MQRVLVTAGASGIGLAIAQVFLRQGAQVHVCDVSEGALANARSESPALRASRADVGDAQQVNRLGDEIDAAWGGLDVIVNNAGIGGPRAPLEEVSDADWDAVMRVNVTGMFHVVRRFAPGLKAQRSGSIINVSSTSSRTGLPNRTPYIVSKAAVEGLTKNLARELGPFNIRCNSLLPGSMENERSRALLQARADREGRTYESVLAERLSYISMRSRIDPEEVGDMAAFLASDAARHISGQQIGVCGNVEWEI